MAQEEIVTLIKEYLDHVEGDYWRETVHENNDLDIKLFPDLECFYNKMVSKIYQNIDFELEKELFEEFYQDKNIKITDVETFNKYFALQLVQHQELTGEIENLYKHLCEES